MRINLNVLEQEVVHSALSVYIQSLELKLIAKPEDVDEKYWAGMQIISIFHANKVLEKISK